MKTQIFILGFLITFTNFAIPECKAQSSLNQNDIHKQSQQTMTKQTGEPSVEIEFVDVGFVRAPLTTLLMDVTLHNHYNQPCWFLLPGKIDSSKLGQGGVNTVEVFEFRGQGRVIAGRFLGNPSLRAFLLPAGANVKLRELPIELWGPNIFDKKQVEVELVIASQLTINGESAEAWFGTNPISDIQADVTVEERHRIGSKEMPNFDEVPVSIVEKERFQVLVPLF